MKLITLQWTKPQLGYIENILNNLFRCHEIKSFKTYERGGENFFFFFFFYQLKQEIYKVKSRKAFTSVFG